MIASSTLLLLPSAPAVWPYSCRSTLTGSSSLSGLTSSLFAGQTTPAIRPSLVKTGIRCMHTTNSPFEFGRRLRGLAEIVSRNITRAGFAVLLLAFSSLASAQTPDTGSIRGQILDPNGAAIVGADVSATNQLTGFSQANNNG